MARRFAAWPPKARQIGAFRRFALPGSQRCGILPHVICAPRRAAGAKRMQRTKKSVAEGGFRRQAAFRSPSWQDLCGGRDRLVEETLMLRSLRHRAETLPRFSAEALPSGGQLTRILLTVGTLSSFGWLLLQNRIHPIVVFLLEIYLTF
jgi:hypothetical protein